MPRRACPRKARLVGAYQATPLCIGHREHCLYRDVLCRVTSWTDAPIPWPRGVQVGKRGAGSVIVTEEFVRAVRQESAAAVCWHWNLDGKTVAQYRRAFGATRTSNPRSHELMRSNGVKGAQVTS